MTTRRVSLHSPDRPSTTHPMTIDEVDTFARSLPGVTVDLKWRHRTWMVGDKHFAWQRPFSKADIKRFGDEQPPTGEILAVMVESLDAKDALLAIAPRGFFTIPHFNGYAAVLIELKRARVKDVRAAVLDAYRTRATKTATKKPRTRAAARHPSKKGQRFGKSRTL